MVKRWVGIVASGDKVTMVDVEVPTSGPLILQMDQTLKLQDGDRPKAYDTLYHQLVNYFSEKKIGAVVVKASAASKGSLSLAHLTSAEVRGVALAAAASTCEVRAIAKATISKGFGKRKVDEYLSDNQFWDDNISGHELRIGSREAAMLLIAAREKQ
jgi:hypothetical protein